MIQRKKMISSEETNTKRAFSAFPAKAGTLLFKNIIDPCFRRECRNKKSNAEKGSVFFYILLGVVLFGTLAFTVSRGMRGTQTDSMSDRTAELAASDLLNYAQKIQRAVDRVRNNGCSENDISFDHTGWGHTNYQHSPVVNNECKIFHQDGGNLSFSDVSSYHDKYVTNMGNYIFSGRSAVSGLGTTCVAATCTELYLFIRMFHAAKLCKQINKSLDISTSLPVSAGLYSDQLYKGTFSYGNTLSDAAFIGKNGGCYQHSSATYTDGTPYYDLYYVLLAR